MFYDGILIAIITGLFRKGNFNGFAELRLRGGWIFPILLILQILIFIFQSKSAWVASVSDYFFLGVYVIGLYFLWINRQQPGFYYILVGVFLNFLVMALNGGRMPVSLEASSVLDPSYLEALQSGVYAKHQLLNDATWLGFLGDIIPLSNPYPRDKVISVGDVIMNIGGFVFVLQLMLSRKKAQAETSLLEEAV
ncbi:hypothetical protein EHS13_03145 [Paenibacillus psychroresistens]|uniref:DUF5317 domain-containing protein n=1 Tax=Paenibacillus psychroresistens TaxID=1778678 RepID=A0A6B8RES0_9BACL|nr:DUF5317 domain-containing protein [Paenibacillus psychroresistens]QGQ93972.1 hypothetical protein EHS13_03145 [Paenibacillus psychroresistens]